jgi:hypothetical protein
MYSKGGKAGGARSSRSTHLSASVSSSSGGGVDRRPRDGQGVQEGDVLLADLPGSGIDDDVGGVAVHPGQAGHGDLDLGPLVHLSPHGASGGLTGLDGATRWFRFPLGRAS